MPDHGVRARYEVGVQSRFLEAGGSKEGFEGVEAADFVGDYGGEGGKVRGGEDAVHGVGDSDHY